jgi:hypothetical protein
MTHRFVILLPATCLALFAPAAAGWAQAPGYAEITSPRSGETLEGMVSIQGTADHPAFLGYDLSFAHDPVRADTWFPLGEPVQTRARQSPLGLFDTTELTPGLYQIRLRVHLEGGASLEHIVRSLRVGLTPPPATATSPSSAADGPASATPTPTPAPPQPAVADDTPARSDPVGLALRIGGLTAAALLLGLGVLVPLRRSMAAWAGSMRMRRLHRREQRRRRARGSR